MKSLILVLLIVIPCFSRELITFDEIDRLFSRHLQENLSPEDEVKLDSVFELMEGSLDSLETLGTNRRTVLCVLCRSALSAFIDHVRGGLHTEKDLTEMMTNICIRVGITSKAVCEGAVKLNLPIIDFIIRNTEEASASEFCGLILQNPTDPNACPFDERRFEYVIDIPPPRVTPVQREPVNTNTRELKVALITDAHLDPRYEAFGVANCDEPTCCRFYQREAAVYEYRSNFNESSIEDVFINVDGEVMIDLEQADIIQRIKRASRTKHLRSSEPAGYWGDYRNCDTPIWAYDDVIERIAEDHPDIDLVYYMGDTIDHGVWETSFDLINNMNSYLINKMKTEFGPNVPVIPIIGNHESQPTNQFAPPDITQPGLDTHWLYRALAEKWAHYLDDRAIQSLLDRGEFSMRFENGLRVISLNTNVAYKWNWWIVYNPQDARRHLDWLVTELLEAEAAGEKVHLLTHIPPGSHDLTRIWTREYNRIVNRFSSIIMAEFNGHTHGDEFRVFYNQNNQPINVAWIVGAATAYTHYNLNYKIASFTSNNYELQNFQTYIYNLTEANMTPHKRPHWFMLSDFRNSFQVPDLSAQSIDNLVHHMATTERRLLELYAAFNSRISDNRWPQCDLNCQLDHLCNTVITVLWSRERCEELLRLFHINNAL